RILQTLRFGADAISLSPDGTQLAVGSVLNPRDRLDLGIWLVTHPGMKIPTENRQVTLWDVATGKQISAFKGEVLDFSWTDKGFVLFDQNGFSLCHAISGKKFADIKAPPDFQFNWEPISDNLLPIPKRDFLAIFATHFPRPNPFFQWFPFLPRNKGSGVDLVTEMTFFDASTGEELASIVVGGVMVSPDGKSLASWGQKNSDEIEIWDIPPRKPLHWALGLLAIPSMVTMFALWKW